MKKVGVPLAPSCRARSRSPCTRARWRRSSIVGAEALDVEAIQAFRQHRQVLLVRHLALLLEQHVVHVPELALAGGGFGRFRGQLGQRVEVGQRQVAEHQADAA
jgi:hypothetical protein